MKCGRVFFTISADAYIEGDEPNAASVAGRIGCVIAATMIGGPIAIALVGTLAGVTSVRGLKMDGVYADGRIAVVRGRTTKDGVYELYFHSIENA